ncbi:propionyl-CoA carboxylase-like protein [Xylaria bambusicola]|uniref:propionyl-CoA carboxylase-like protein n=1 Tax=Xylaria bambusicola TaxID=326684 RepID=UPI002008E33D|nr:propionyl-CoA carboxylase-like protein [Xylaria bambusicola]KAI0505398.1 propionyl-CoA carboxylase-like protein [Xylaria bambusicola]
MASDEGSASQRARERVQQVSSHLAHLSDPKDDVVRSPTRRRRKQATAPAGPPADYSDRLGQIKTLETLARTPDINHRGYARQKKAGKLWVRERVEALLDEGSLQEIGSVAGDVIWGKAKNEYGTEQEVVTAFTPSNSVQGYGHLNGRKIVLTADDYTLRAGHADGALMEKTLYIEKLALSLRLPIVKLVDGSSGGGSVTSIRQSGFSYIPPLPAFEQVIAQLNLGIPNLGAVLGPAIGLGAARVTACHFSVMAANVGSLFNAGPHVVKGVTFEDGLTMAELGGPDMHCRNGTIDNMAHDEHDAFEQIRCVLSYLPNSGFSAPSVIKSGDAPDRREDALRSLIPRRKERMYDPRRLITLVLDNGSFFEIGALWGTTAIVGLGRLEGHPIGIVSNNCESHTGGALDALGSQKITKHLKLCDVMNLPILQFVDVPGYAVGTAAERSATMRYGVNLAMAYYTTTMPVFSVVTRRAYGVAGGVMLDCRDPRMRVAWPSGDWGSLPLKGGIEAGHSHELKEAARKGGQKMADELYAKLEAEYNGLMNPVRTANAFGVEQIIDPADTRPVVCNWISHVYEELMAERLAKRRAGTLHASFA